MKRSPEGRLLQEAKKFPTNAEIDAVFDQIKGIREFEKAQPITDGHGNISARTMIVTNVDGSRERFQYQYFAGMRGYEETPKILVMDVLKDESTTPPVVLAEYRNGKWEMKDGVDRKPKQ